MICEVEREGLVGSDEDLKGEWMSNGMGTGNYGDGLDGAAGRAREIGREDIFGSSKKANTGRLVAGI